MAIIRITDERLEFNTVDFGSLPTNLVIGFVARDVDLNVVYNWDGSNWVEPNHDSVQFNPQDPNPTYQEGKVFYDGVKKALSYYNDESDTTINLGQEIVRKVHNDNGATLINGMAVRLDGGNVGGVPTVVRAQADTVDNARAYGIVTHDIPVGDTGYVTLVGQVGDVDTSAFSEGDFLFVSATTLGMLVNVEQSILKVVAQVDVSHATEGVITVVQRPIVNVTAIGQIGVDAGESQTISTTPVPLDVYLNTPFEKNVTITQPGSAPYTASMSPSSIGATGFYRAAFNITISSGTNAVFFFEVYIDGVSTGVLSAIDLSNGSIDAGSCAFDGITTETIDNTENVEVYVYCDSGTPSFIAAAGNFNVERIGNV